MAKILAKPTPINPWSEPPAKFPQVGNKKKKNKRKSKRNEFVTILSARSKYTPRRTTSTFILHTGLYIFTHSYKIITMRQKITMWPPSVYSLFCFFVWPIGRAPTPKFGPSKGSMNFYYVSLGLLQLYEKNICFERQGRLINCSIYAKYLHWASQLHSSTIADAPDPQCWLLVVLLVLSLLAQCFVKGK